MPDAPSIPPPAGADLTPALATFLARADVPTPYVVVDVDVVEDRYHALRAALPEATVYYAVKANPSLPVVRRLVEAGSSFDVASPAEIDRCLEAGASPSGISYGNTIKKRRDVAYAASCGVTRYTVDAAPELDKVIAEAPGADVCVRLLHDCGGSDWPLSRKFGCEAPDVVRLLDLASAAGMRSGVSFHVGSQQRHVGAWDAALETVAAIARRAQTPLDFVNLGGGFPGTYAEPSPDVAHYGAAIRDSLQRWFPDGTIELMVEPGRYLVADAGVLRSEVVLVSRRSADDDERWVYLDCGRFHGLAETMDEAIRYQLVTAHDGSPTGPAALAGPTCDSADVLYEKNLYHLPLALTEGDYVDILAAGAYTTTYSSVGFNGFAPLAEHHVTSRR